MSKFRLGACFLLVWLSCSRTPFSGGREELSPHASFCTPGEPDCMRVLPPSGTFRAHVELRVQALSAPPLPAEPGNWTEPKVEFVQGEDVLLAREAGGNVRGERNLTDEEGIHFVHVGNVFCLGFRYEPAVCRTPDEGEVALRMAELEGTYGQVLERVAGRMEWKKSGEGWVAVLREEGKKDENDAVVRSLTGTAKKARDGQDIHVRLSYELEGSRPDGLRYRLQVRYEHTVSRTVEPIAIPENALHHEGRHRPLLDRKALLGDPVPAALRHLYGRSKEE